MVVQVWAAAKLAVPTSRTCERSRRVATDTAASVAGPAAMPDSALIAAMRSAIGTGARRRKWTSTKAATPSPTSVTKSARCSRHSISATLSHTAAEKTTHSASRHAWSTQRRGGWVSEAVGRVSTAASLATASPTLDGCVRAPVGVTLGAPRRELRGVGLRAWVPQG